MELTAWVYPWDIARLGARSVLTDLAGSGITGVNLAATYHPISIVSPRGPHVSGFFAPSGGVFFPARPERYGRIAPAVWPDQSVTGAWGDAAALLDDLHLQLHAWTIGLYQPWMAQQHPHAARTFATGDRIDAGVCASNPDVRDYLGNLVADLAGQFPVSVVKLEGVHNPGYNYGWIRPRVYFTLTPRQQRLLGLCFCDACVTLGRELGVDVDAARAAVLGQLEAEAEAGGGDDGDGGDEHEAVQAYAAIAPEAGRRLVAHVAERLHESRAEASLAVATPNEAGGTGVPVEDLLDHVGTVLLMNLRGNRAEVERTAAVVAGTGGRVDLEYMLHPPFTSAGTLPTAIDETLSEPSWLRDLDDAIGLGVSRLSLYNYGLLTPSTFAALVEVARRATSSAGPTVTSR